MVIGQRIRIGAGPGFAHALAPPPGDWAAREQARPFGLRGLLIGLGAGAAGLVAFATARCAASNFSGPDYVSGCVTPDLTAFFVAAAVLAAIGVGVTLLAIARRG